MQTTNDSTLHDALGLASQAGHILLENGAEISRVEETMERIATYFGATECNFFVLSNGIFTTGRNSLGKEEYANVEFIPIKGAQLEKVSAVNQLSRDIVKGEYTLEQAREQLEIIRNMKPKPAYIQILGAAFGSAAFCAIFGGGMSDCAASFVAGLLLWVFYIFPCAKMSRILANILSSALVTLICIILYNLGLGKGLGHMIIGSIIPLIPGVPFTNGIRDLTNGDYIAGTTRLLDALIGFFCIALGVCITFMVYARITGGMPLL